MRACSAAQRSRAPASARAVAVGSAGAAGRSMRTPVRLGDWFDLVGGTSTGALIAGALALGFRTDQIKEFYLRLAPKAFQPTRWGIPLFQAKFNADGLRAEILKIVQDRLLSSTDLITGLCVVTKRMDTCSPWIVANNPNAPYWGAGDTHDANQNYSLATLVRPSNLLVPTILSIGAWSLECAALWVVLRGLGQSTEPGLATFFYATSTLAGALVPVPGGLGVTEATLQGQLQELGHVTPAASTAAMILVRFATLWFAVLVGFLALWALKRRYPGLLAGAERNP